MDNNNPLTLEILCAYLPSKAKVTFEGDDLQHDLVGVDFTNQGAHLISPFGDFGRSEIAKCKLLLRPLSDMDKPLEELGGKSTFRVINDMLPKGAAFPIRTNNNWIGLMVFMPYVDCPQVSIDWPTIEKIRSLLLSLKYDLYGGIPSGWALDLNTYGK